MEQSTHPETGDTELVNRMQVDLYESGLTELDLKSRTLDMSERAACSLRPDTQGYVIPYFSALGRPLPFYRVKLFDRDIKYLQLKDTPNHVYFPPKFLECLDRYIATLGPDDKGYIVLTEGEKKAAAAVKHGFPTCAFGGVDSWRNKVLLLPKGTTFSTYSYNKQLVGAKLPSSGWEGSGMQAEPLAVGFEELCALLRQRNLHAVICYDTDEQTAVTGVRLEVQKAAAALGFELRSKGIPIHRIRQLVLPNVSGATKTGLDDFLKQKGGKAAFRGLLDGILSKRSAFPKHPAIEDDINRKLQQSKLGRKDTQRLSLQVITDLDSRGVRMFSKKEEQLYYFEDDSNRLIKVNSGAGAEKMHSTPFSTLLYQYYGISTSADQRLLNWLSTQFSGEAPVEDVSPYRIFARPEVNADCVRYQIGDGQYVKITGDKNAPITIHRNGDENVLFEGGMVEEIDAKELLAEFEKRKTEPLSMWWEDVLNEVRLKNHGKVATLYSLLYYISPWLFRWRGSQLPVELVIGEAGSGKSTLCELRLEILTGQPKLRGAPDDMKDWHASIINTGGLHVTDNVQMLDKALRQKVSDELCRLITEPEPHIEARKYYTNSDLVRMPVTAVFCFTALLQPFPNGDLLQRAVILELDKLAKNSSVESESSVVYDAEWKNNQIKKFGGRTAWISHHLYVLHKFFEKVEADWNPKYSAKHRLINLEQMLVTMADLFGIESDWIPEFLSNQITDAVVEADWSLEGLKEFVLQVNTAIKDNKIIDFANKIDANQSKAKEKVFTTNVIATWAAQQDAFMECTNLTNSRRLGRYLQTHKAMIAHAVGLLDTGVKDANRTQYKVK